MIPARETPATVRSIRFRSRCCAMRRWSWTAAPVRTQGEVLGVVLTFRDASAQRWEERQLRQAHRLEAAGKLAAGAAAEYTTLIAIIRKQNELLLRQFGDYSAAREPLEEIHRAAAAA